MTFEPASEGFLDFFKKKSKQPSKVEKNNILDRMTPGSNISEINSKLMETYPNEAKKEFDKRQKFLKELLNIITDLSKKYKDLPGLEFDSYIETIKSFINHKDAEYTNYNDFMFMHNLIPAFGPKSKKYEWAYSSNFYLDIFWYDVWEWAEKGPYKDDFKSGTKIVRDFDDTGEYWGMIETVVNEFKNKLKSSEFFYAIDCGGDWDDGGYTVNLKPSKEIISLATRCSSYKDEF